MKIKLETVRDQPFSWHERLEVPATSLERDDVLELSPIEWRGQVSFVDPDYRLRGRLAYEQTLVCTRCLKPFADPVKVDFEALLVPVKPASGAREGGGDHRLAEDELGVMELTGEDLDLEPILLEQLQLQVPMKALCRPDCAGLCPRCGADRNAGPCACGEDEVDPRWSGLEALRERFTRREEKEESKN